jgi:hypothetical protein
MPHHTPAPIFSEVQLCGDLLGAPRRVGRRAPWGHRQICQANSSRPRTIATASRRLSAELVVNAFSKRSAPMARSA